VRHHAWTDDARVDARRPPFDRVTISLHWASVILVLTLFASAWLHPLAEARQSDLTPAVLQIHRSFGMIIWVMTALRLSCPHRELCMLLQPNRAPYSPE
jgi:cytochrome b561